MTRSCERKPPTRRRCIVEMDREKTTVGIGAIGKNRVSNCTTSWSMTTHSNTVGILHGTRVHLPDEFWIIVTSVLLRYFYISLQTMLSSKQWRWNHVKQITVRTTTATPCHHTLHLQETYTSVTIRQLGSLTKASDCDVPSKHATLAQKINSIQQSDIQHAEVDANWRSLRSPLEHLSSTLHALLHRRCSFGLLSSRFPSTTL